MPVTGSVSWGLYRVSAVPAAVSAVLPDGTRLGADAGCGGGGDCGGFR